MTTYMIKTAVTADGQPTYALYREVANMFGAGVVKLAENQDRGVLEKAIEHLTQGKEGGQ